MRISRGLGKCPDLDRWTGVVSMESKRNLGGSFWKAFSRKLLEGLGCWKAIAPLDRWQATRRLHSAACAHGGRRLLGFRKRGTLATPEIKRNT